MPRPKDPIVFFLFLLSFVYLSFSQIAFACRWEESPEKTQKIQENVFMMIPIRQAVSPWPEERTKDYLEKNCNPGPGVLSEQLNCEHLRRCSDDCQKIFGKHGSAFLLGDGRSLYTAWHVAFQIHEVALNAFFVDLSKRNREKQLSAYSGMRPSFVLANFKGEIVYDSRQSDLPPATYEVIGDPLSMIYGKLGRKGDQAYGYLESVGSDFVKINLPESLAEGLSPAKFSKKEDSCVYASGFAFDSVHTEFKIRGGKQKTLTSMKEESDHFSSFELVPLETPLEKIREMPVKEQLELMGYTPESIKRQLKENPIEVIREAIGLALDRQPRHMRDLVVEKKQGVIFSQALAESGQSGGPYLNAKGEVLGIVTNAFSGSPDVDGKTKAIGSAGALLELFEKDHTHYRF